MKNLVIVESPSKAHTINKYLGNDFIVKATVGHIKNLPKKNISVDIKNGFEPKYEIITGKEKTVEEIKKLAKGAKNVYIAADPDREGEAIAWNIKEVIDTIRGAKPELKRVLFHEITKEAVNNAINNPVSLNEPMYESQKARRILDRLVGYNLSPFLWDKIRRGLSAGRVQSVALYIIVEREKEINSFVKEEYWTVTALFDIEIGKESAKDKKNKTVGIEAELVKIDGKDPKIINEESVIKLKESLLKVKDYKIADIGKKQTIRKPPLPLITSTLQQEAAKIFRFSVKKTMSVAQKLYEGIELGAVEGISVKPLGPLGLITYMRTDSTRISEDAAAKTKNFISETFGKNYLGGTSAKKKVSSKKVQDAHEAIRPTNVSLSPVKIKEYLNPDEFKLYNLIWTYSVASLMKESLYDQYGIVIKGFDKTSSSEYSFKTTESVLFFDGYQKIMNENLKKQNIEEKEGALDEKNLQKIFALLGKNDPANIKKVDTFQHFTSPPSRYTEATLVKALDENGIGRPSTYQSIIANIKTKDYVVMTTESADNEKKGSSTQKFKPTELGMTVSDILKEGFSDILDLKFTANLEKKLDEIENGEITRVGLLTDFYNKFMKELTNAKVKIKTIKGSSEPTDIICDKCGKPMVIKTGRFGKFLACSGYPECKNAKPVPVKQNNNSKISCPEGCGGYLVEKRTKKGRFFFGCSNYPKCEYASWSLPKSDEKSEDR